MGAIAESIVAYAQPLLDETDGSVEAMNRAFAVGQLCWNLALSPKEVREEILNEMRPTLGLDDDEFDEFRQVIVAPMIERHREMFPQFHRHFEMAPLPLDHSPRAHARIGAPTEKYPGTEPYAPCPCQSGRKYKFCCRASGR